MRRDGRFKGDRMLRDRIRHASLQNGAAALAVLVGLVGVVAGSTATAAAPPDTNIDFEKAQQGSTLGDQYAPAVLFGGGAFVTTGFPHGGAKAASANACVESFTFARTAAVTSSATF